MFKRENQYQSNINPSNIKKQYQRWHCAPHKALKQYQPPSDIAISKTLVLRIFKAIPQYQLSPPKGGCAWLTLPPRTPIGFDQ
jgi:hypothetical protein